MMISTAGSVQILVRAWRLLLARSPLLRGVRSLRFWGAVRLVVAFWLRVVSCAARAAAVPCGACWVALCLCRRSCLFAVSLRVLLQNFVQDARPPQNFVQAVPLLLWLLLVQVARCTSSADTAAGLLRRAVLLLLPS